MCCGRSEDSAPPGRPPRPSSLTTSRRRVPARCRSIGHGRRRRTACPDPQTPPSSGPSTSRWPRLAWTRLPFLPPGRAAWRGCWRRRTCWRSRAGLAADHSTARLARARAEVARRREAIRTSSSGRRWIRSALAADRVAPRKTADTYPGNVGMASSGSTAPSTAVPRTAAWSVGRDSPAEPAGWSTARRDSPTTPPAPAQVATAFRSGRPGPRSRSTRTLLAACRSGSTHASCRAPGSSPTHRRRAAPRALEQVCLSPHLASPRLSSPLILCLA